MKRTTFGPHVLLLAAALLVIPGLAGCAAHSSGDTAWTAAPAADAGNGGGMADAMRTAWANRPGYVRANTRTEEGYAFAMAHPEVLQWMPCYCGCSGMGHRSNLDCFFKPTMAGLSGLTFEEHASGCQICVDEALMAKQLIAGGQSLRSIRATIDQTFGGSAPGTPTELPPA